jgi:hypothetical protein
MDLGLGQLPAYSGSTIESSIFVAKLDPAGNAIWEVEWVDRRHDLVAARRIRAPRQRRGWMQGTVDLGGGPITAHGGRDALVAIFAP